MKPGPQKAQTAQTRDLDEAIDLVGRQMTHVDESPEFAARIVASLPERVSWFGWLSHSWVPRLAVLAIAVLGGWMLTRGNSRVVPLDATPMAAVAPSAPSVTAPVVVATNLEPVSTKPVERVEPLEPVEPPRGDHEFALVAVRVPAALDVESLTAAELPTEASIEIAPLAIADLPLSSEFPQRD